MAHYTSKYKSLGFYVGGNLIKFANGEYTTTDKAEIAVLDATQDAVKTVEAKPATKPKPTTKTKEA